MCKFKKKILRNKKKIQTIFHAMIFYDAFNDIHIVIYFPVLFTILLIL